MTWQLAIFTALFLGMLYFTGYNNGKNDCKEAYARKSQEAVKHSVQSRDKVTHEVIRSSDSDLDKRLARWMRPNL